MTKVLNKYKDKVEKALKERCPKCKGYGRRFGEDETCHICNGIGTAWVAVSDSGWTRPMYSQISRSQLF